MANILTHPTNGAIYFGDGTAGSSTVPALTGGAVSLKYDGSAGLNIASYNTTSTDRFSIDGSSGRLFSVNDSLTGTIFSVNDAAGLPIIEVESTSSTDTITMGTYASNALVVAGDKVGIGTATPNASYKLDVVGAIRASTAIHADGDLSATGDLEVFGSATISTNVIVSGNLTVNGTTTTINSTTLQVDDKNIELGTVATPTDATADGGGITLKGATDKTINWVNSTDAWTFSDPVAAPGLDINGAANISGNLEVGEYILRSGQSSNYHRFLASRQIFVVGNTSSIDLNNGVSTFGATSGATTLQGSSLLLDSAGDITLDAGGQDIILSDDGTIFGTLSNSSGLQIRSRVNNADMLFRGVDDGTEFTALTLDMSEGGNATFTGNVGIGTTPPTTNVHTQLFIGTTAYLLGSTGGALDLGVNLYYNSGWKYRTTNAASLLDFTATGKTILYTAPSGTANSAATITPRFTVDNTGNVGIGTTSPAAKLDISSGHIRMSDGYKIDWGGTNARIDGSNADNRLRFFTSGVEKVRIDSSGNVLINQSAVTYTNTDNASLITTPMANVLHVNGSIQMKENNSAIVFGRGNSTFLQDEELAFGWGGGIYMTDGSWLRIRNNKGLYTTGILNGGSLQIGGNTAIDASRNITAGTITATGGTLTGTLNSQDIKLGSGYHLMRSSHHTGHLEGSYNNIGDNRLKSNPIYTIGSSYNPADATLGSMYGTGYTHDSASFISFTGAAGWGQYIAANGVARVWLGGQNGVISSTGQHYVGSNVVWNAGNDGTGTGLDADLLDGIEGNKFLRTTTAPSLAGPGMADTTLSIGDSGSSYAFVQSHGKTLRINPAGNSVTIGSSNGTAWHSANDGTGSGLDADLLDGKHASEFVEHMDGSRTNTTNLNSYVTSGFYNTGAGTHTNKPSGASDYAQLIVAKGVDTGLQIYGGYSNSTLYVRGWHSSGTFYGWKKIWNDGNDGTGSGLDADLLDGYHATAFQGAITAPNAPASVTTTIVGETIDVTFAASTTSNIDAYLVYSSIAGSDYGLISVVPPDDFSASMSIIDNSFDETGTQAYRVYAMKLGKLSSATTGSVSYTVSTADPTTMSVVNLNNAYYVQWNPPSSNSRFVTVYNVYKHEHATQGSLSRASASLVYSGTNTNYMYQINGTNNNNFHQFWVETTIA